MWEPAVGHSRAVRVGGMVWVGGTTEADPGGGVVGRDDPAEQAREALRRIEAALVTAGATLADVVRTRIYLTDMTMWQAVGAVDGEVFADVRPASTMVAVAALIDPALLVEIEADAVVDPG